MLTEAGKHLLPYAAEMVELYEKARHIPENDQEPSGNLIIGASESLTVYRLPAILHEFTNKYPQVTVTLKSSTCWQLRDELKQGKIDVAFLLDNDRKENDLHVEKLVNEPMVFIFPKEHPAGQKALDDLTFTANETFYIRSTAAATVIFLRSIYVKGESLPTIRWNFGVSKRLNSA